jgi:hypothetical protein
MRRGRSPLGGTPGPRLSSLGLLLALASACGKSEDEAAAKKVFDYAAVNVGADSKALVYNLIGRWFPEEEIQRLDDDTLTPEAWCQREPAMVMVLLDEVTVQCEVGAPTTAAIARVERAEGGGISLVLRAAESSPLKVLTFRQVLGTKAEITGVPCFQGQAHAYARFPRIEILQRQILQGKRCAQIAHDGSQRVAPPTDDLESEE